MHYPRGLGEVGEGIPPIQFVQYSPPPPNLFPSARLLLGKLIQLEEERISCLVNDVALR